MVRNEKAMRDIVETVHVKVSQRIFRQSGSSDINNVRLGKYSQGYRRQRIKAGHLNTQNINLFGIRKTTEDGTPRGKNRYVTSGQMKEDFSPKENVIKLLSKPGVLKFGSGFKNDVNYKKSLWVEKTYNKQDKIFALSEEEEKLFYNLNEKYIQRNLNA